MKTDIRRLQACLDHKDYSAIVEYIELIKEKYNKEEREVFSIIVSLIKSGKYKNISVLLQKLHI